MKIVYRQVLRESAPQRTEHELAAQERYRRDELIVYEKDGKIYYYVHYVCETDHIGPFSSIDEAVEDVDAYGYKTTFDVEV